MVWFFLIQISGEGGFSEALSRTNLATKNLQRKLKINISGDPRNGAVVSFVLGSWERAQVISWSCDYQLNYPQYEMSCT